MLAALLSSASLQGELQSLQKDAPSDRDSTKSTLNPDGWETILTSAFGTQKTSKQAKQNETKKLFKTKEKQTDKTNIHCWRGCGKMGTCTLVQPF